MPKTRFIESPGHLSESKLLIIFAVRERERERERESSRSPVVRRVVGWCVGWLVGCFGLKGPLRQYFSLYRAVSQREGERKEK